MRSRGPAPPWTPGGWLLVIPTSLCSKPDTMLERNVLELGRSKPHRDLSPHLGTEAHGHSGLQASAPSRDRVQPLQPRGSASFPNAPASLSFILLPSLLLPSSALNISCLSKCCVRMA